MKKLIFILLTAHALLFTIHSIAQPCLPEGIIFSTQTQIDNFQINYPGCTEIEGDVVIHGVDITNLNGLNVLTTIGGNLIIRSNEVLTNLHGLNSLDTVYGSWTADSSLVIMDNPALTSLQGLENLDYVGSFGLEINNNDALTSLTGLEGLSTLNINLTIANNDALSSLTGLDNLDSIKGYYWWNGGLAIINNDALVNLEGLENLTAITYSDIGYKGGVFICNNDNLSSLNGIEYLEFIDLTIVENPLLSECNVKSICEHLIGPIWSIDIHDNAPGCNSKEELEEACAQSVGDISVISNLSIYPNPFSNTITIGFELKQPEIVTITIYNHLGKQAEVIKKNQSQGRQEIIWNAENLPAGVYFCVLKTNKGMQSIKMIKL
ncbi:T9SS type A sorting domain-containing protein [Desulfosarcina sp.]|nr:T9SS type A sorting domain-containing protein [Desulfosarcina sp.]